MPRRTSNRSKHQLYGIGHVIGQAPRLLLAVARLFTPAARGVYPPHIDSPVIIGVVLAPDVDPDETARRLWWRGLGIVQRDGQIIAGADITAAVYQHRVRKAHQFVTKQLRSAGVRGRIRRWELHERSRRKRRKRA